MKNIMKTIRSGIVASAIAGSAASATSAVGARFGEDVKFFEGHTPVIVLSDRAGRSKVAVVPAWQGRVMTSTAGGDAGSSFGWVNRELIASGKVCAAYQRVWRRRPFLARAGGRPVSRSSSPKARSSN